MITVYSPAEWVERFGDNPKSTVVTIGNFDGVHLGHQRILYQTRSLAGQLGSRSVVLTFYPHPARVLRPSKAPPLLITLEQRITAIEEMRIDAAMVLKFDSGLATMSARDFADHYLREILRTRALVIGDNFRFGRRQEGNIHLLSEMAFEVEPIRPVEVDGVVVSSTRIREEASEGRMENARKMLGRPFTLAGEIRPGTAQGRKRVVPTLNLATEQELLPKIGVYATETAVGGTVHRSVTNVGMRPTFEGLRLSIESHLFDFNDNLNSGKMAVRFWSRLRDEKKFADPEALREQVLVDIGQAREFFVSKDRTDA
jgi:riboflavin kinase/FMN adenylyltransferase